MLLTNTFLAVLVVFALVVQSIDWTTFAHFGHWTITEKEAVATIGPVLAIVEFLTRVLLLPELLGNGLQVLVAEFIGQINQSLC